MLKLGNCKKGDVMEKIITFAEEKENKNALITLHKNFSIFHM
jgi:hypothetical protein